MNILTDKPMAARTWRWARLGAYLCFVLASVLMLASLLAPHAKPHPGASTAGLTDTASPQG